MSPSPHPFGSRIARFGYTVLGFCAAVGAMGFLHGAPVQAQAPGINLTALYNQVQTLQTKLDAETARAKAAEAQLQTNINNISLTPGPAGPQGPAGPTGATGPAGASPFTVSGHDVTLSGYNLHIVSGSGSTNDGGGALTGLGNLIIGYNALGNNQGNGDVRTGSHNLILGDQNNYSSFGGLVAGSDNSISGLYATVSSGRFNTASGFWSSVSGGNSNTANGFYSSVSGGGSNTASGGFSSVSGGNGNTASGGYSPPDFFNNSWHWNGSGPTWWGAGISGH